MPRLGIRPKKRNKKGRAKRCKNKEENLQIRQYTGEEDLEVRDVREEDIAEEVAAEEDVAGGDAAEEDAAEGDAAEEDAETIIIIVEENSPRKHVQEDGGEDMEHDTPKQEPGIISSDEYEK